MNVHPAARGCPCPVAGRSLRACDCRAVAAVAASAPAYGRRARPGSQHPALRSLDASSASPSWLRVGSNAGSRGTGSPSLPRRGKAVAEGQRLIWLPHTMTPFHQPPPARMAGPSSGCNGHNCVAAERAAGPDGRPIVRLQRPRWRCSRKAEGTGFEPATDFSASDFESDR